MSESREAFVLAPGEARRNPSVQPTLKAGAADTAGVLSIHEGYVPARTAGPPLHVGEGDESFYVLEGTLTIQAGDHVHEVASGGFVWVPRGTPHTFANRSGAPARMLSISVPGGVEAMFAERASYLSSTAGPPDPRRVIEIAERHGGRHVGPPLAL
jgi:mannose-6-phosphate isomerase-like protein (cupin superfamily)